MDWNRGDASDDFRENKAPANVLGFLFRCPLLALIGHGLLRRTCLHLTRSGHQYSNYSDDGFYDLRGLTFG